MLPQLDSAKPCAYVAQGASGLLKVGFTKRPTQRLALLKREFKSKGDELVRFAPCIPTHGAWVVERLLISFCRKHCTKHSGFEWFVNASFDSVKAFADAESAARIDAKPAPIYTEEDSARWRAAAEARRAAHEAERAAHRARMERRRHNAQYLPRHRAKRVFAAMVVSCVGSDSSMLHSSQFCADEPRNATQLNGGGLR